MEIVSSSYKNSLYGGNFLQWNIYVNGGNGVNLQIDSVKVLRGQQQLQQNISETGL